MKKKLICLILVISVFCLTACGGDSGGGADINDAPDNLQNNDSADAEPETAADPREEHNPNFDRVDMQGYVFTIGTRDDATHNYPAHTRDLFAEEVTGDLINDAVYARNMAIEEKFNIKIEMQDFPEDVEQRPNEIVERNFLAGDKSFDLLMSHMHHALSTAVKGTVHDIAGFPNIDLSKPYWSQGATRGLSLNHRLYVGLSDLSFSTNENLYCIFFNKSMLRDHGIEDPYTFVKNNQWTFDTFNNIIRQGYVDLNGSGTVDSEDQFGYLSSSAMNFLWSGGSQIVRKDSDDMPVLDYLNEKTIAAFEKAFDITNNPFTWKVQEWFQAGPMEMFANGQGIFYSSQLCRVNDLRATEFDFGIVPYPKWDAAQENYFSFVDGHASMMAVPRNLPNDEWTGMIIEELSFMSYRDILPVYYDVVLNVKMVRDEESVEMLKILFDSKNFDFGYVWAGWEFWFIFIENIHLERTDFVSAYERREAAALRLMESRIETVLGFEN